MNQLFAIKKETGLQIGISTSGTNQNEVIAAALKVQIQDESVFDSFQVTYNLFEQSAFEILKEILQEGKTVIIKEALANGRVFPNEKLMHYQSSYKFLKQLSEKYKMGIDAIALRFIIENLQPTYVLSGASNTNQLTQNLKALNFNFTEEELDLFTNLQVSSEKYWKERSLLSWN